MWWRQVAGRRVAVGPMADGLFTGGEGRNRWYGGSECARLGGIRSAMGEMRRVLALHPSFSPLYL